MSAWKILVCILCAVLLILESAFASSALDALRKLQEINRALRGTAERMKQEGNPEQEDRQKAGEKVKRIFRKEMEKARGATPELSDSLIEQGLSLCELQKKRKEELSASAIKKALEGAGYGTAFWVTVAREDRRSEGAIYVALGILLATIHEIWGKKDLLEESPEKLAKRIGYSPEKGIHLKISKLEFNKKSYRDNEDAGLILRVELLTPDFRGQDNRKGGLLRILSQRKEENKESGGASVDSTFYDIKIEAFLIRNNQEVFIAEETYSIPMGSYPFLYVFPMCPIIPKGVYELKFRVTHREISDEKVVSFEKI